MAHAHARSALDTPFAGPLLSAMADNWWLLLLRGIVAIIFGGLAFFMPGITLLSLTLVWGIYVLADGLLSLWAGLSGEGTGGTSRWWLAAIGAVGILAGVGTFVWPGMTALALLTFIAVWAVVSGILQVWGAIQLRKEIQGEWMLILSGLLSIAFGCLLFARPGVSTLALIWTIGLYAVLNGILYTMAAFRLKTYKHA